MTVNDSFRSFVVPLVLNQPEPAGFKYGGIAGTGFLIGSRGFAVTAAHVVDQADESGLDLCAAVVDENNKWLAVRALQGEKHPTEDVALIKLERPLGQSPLVVSADPQHQSCEYDAWEIGRAHV